MKDSTTSMLRMVKCDAMDRPIEMHRWLHSVPEWTHLAALAIGKKEIPSGRGKVTMALNLIQHTSSLTMVKMDSICPYCNTKTPTPNICHSCGYMQRVENI